MTLDEFCSRLEHLRLDRSGALVKPYKPLLVAAVVILIHKRKQQSRNVFLDGGLRSAFQQLLDALFPRWPNLAKPASWLLGPTWKESWIGRGASWRPRSRMRW